MKYISKTKMNSMLRRNVARLTIHSDEILQVEQMYNLKIIQRIGSGVFGTAFLTECNRVVKFTRNTFEFEIAEKMCGNEYKNLVNIYYTNKVNQWFVIVEEYLSDRRTEKFTFLRAKHLVGIQQNDWINFRETTQKIQPETLKFIRDIRQAMIEAQELGLPDLDLSIHNIGFRDDTYVCFDVMERIQSKETI